MTIRHHPGEILLSAYAAGTLHPAPRLVVKAHLDRCHDCARDVAALEAAGGAMLENLPPTPMQDEALARALARIETPPVSSVEAPEPRRRSLGRGAWYRPLHWERGGARAYELYVPAGLRVPEHTHRGREYTCVLQGAIVDETGEYGPGDFIVLDETIVHTPKAGPGEDCICLTASDAPLVMKSWPARLAQLYLRV